MVVRQHAFRDCRRVAEGSTRPTDFANAGRIFVKLDSFVEEERGEPRSSSNQFVYPKLACQVDLAQDSSGVKMKSLT